MRKIFSVLLFVFISIILYSQDMDFGVFNYEGSRLTGMSRYRVKKLEQEIAYIYDKDGYLTERTLTVPAGYKKKDVIYKSYIKYDLSNDIVTEKFDRVIGKRIVPVIFENYYKDGELIRQKRKDGNLGNNKIEDSSDYYFEYNENKDIILIKDPVLTGGNVSRAFTPSTGIGYNNPSIFKYEYFPDKKIRYCLYEKKYFPYDEFIYENNKLVKINQYAVGSADLSSTSNFRYNNNDLLIETIFTIKRDGRTDKITYEYDSKNRLIKRIIWFNRNGVYEEDEVENYYYQDGKYVYYPYLMPPKIKVYFTQAYESLLDKSVF